MILFLQHVAEGKRGGEVYTSHLHTFLKARFNNVEPGQLRVQPQDLRSIIGDVRASLALVKKVKPAVVVIDVSSGVRKVMAARWMKKAGRKIMVVVQGQRISFKLNSTITGWIVRKFEKYLIGSADILLVNSKFIASVVKKTAKSEASIIIARPGLEMQPDVDGRQRKVVSQVGEKMELLTVGEPGKSKGTVYLVEALAHLGDLNCRLNIAGDYSRNDSYFKSLQAVIEKNRLHERVVFHGFLERAKLTELYRRSSIFVLPSLSEGYGMVLAEALIFGLPVVATRISAIPEMITDGVNGILVEPKDHRALADAMRRLALDPKLRAAISEANVERSKSLPTWKDFDSVLDVQLVPAVEKITGLNRK